MQRPDCCNRPRYRTWAQSWPRVLFSGHGNGSRTAHVGIVMQLVEQHCINKSDPCYSVLNEAAFKSKNLYNAANYEIRQAFIFQGKYLDYNEIQRRMRSHEAYKALPVKVSQQILMVL